MSRVKMGTVIIASPLENSVAAVYTIADLALSGKLVILKKILLIVCIL